MIKRSRNRAALIVLCVVVAALLIVGIFAVYSFQSSGRAPLTKITISYKTGGEASYAVFHATTTQQLTEGLMNYTFGNCTANQTNASNSCTNETVGELFSFGNSTNVCFWMKNTPEPLVQVWILENGTVSYIYDGVPYSTNVTCAYGSAVLELGRNLGIPLQVGDTVN